MNAGRSPIAETEYDLDGGAVVVRVYMPRRMDQDFVCEFEIDGLKEPIACRTYGVDSMQALVLALQTVGVNLYTSPEFKAGQLRRHGGDRDLGIPIHDGFHDLVPAPYRPFEALIVLPDGGQRRSTAAANSLEEARAKLENRFGPGAVLDVWEQPPTRGTTNRGVAMAFAIKAADVDLRAETFAFNAQKTMYGGKEIAPGDTIFVFASETQGGQGLVARGVVTAAEDTPRRPDLARQTPRVSIQARRTALAVRPLGRPQLKGFADWDDGRPETELNFKFYRQATNKIVGLTDEAAAFLNAFF